MPTETASDPTLAQIHKRRPSCPAAPAVEGISRFPVYFGTESTGHNALVIAQNARLSQKHDVQLETFNRRDHWRVQIYKNFASRSETHAAKLTGQ